MATELFVDGGNIGRNPSPIGGTWAARLLRGGRLSDCRSGIVTPTELGSDNGLVTNNQMEMYALVQGLWLIDCDETFVVYSDSDITLGRAFRSYGWANIPRSLYEEFGAAVRRLKKWDVAQWHLLDGHPTRQQLITGVGKRGHLVHIENVRCDEMCTREAKHFIEGLQGA